MTFDEAVDLMHYGQHKNPDEIEYCSNCGSDSIGLLAWVSPSGEPRILKQTGIVKCMECGGKNFLVKECYKDTFCCEDKK